MSPRVEVLRDPTPAQARAAIRTLAAAVDDASSPVAATHDLELAVTEVIANALEHGLPPVEVALHRTGRGIEVTVRDAGPGPRGPVGSRPVGGEQVRGRGRWLAHRLVQVRERTLAGGFEVQLTPRPWAARGPFGAHD